MADPARGGNTAFQPEETDCQSIFTESTKPLACGWQWGKAVGLSDTGRLCDSFELVVWRGDRRGRDLRVRAGTATGSGSVFPPMSLSASDHH